MAAAAEAANLERDVRRSRDKGWIVAVDVGMARSGFSYGAAKGDAPVKCHYFTHGHDGVHKVPTAVLLTLDGDNDRETAETDRVPLDFADVDASRTNFGFDARDKYNQLDAMEMDSMLYFERFKMDLASLSHEAPTSLEWQGLVAMRTQALFAATLHYLGRLAERTMAGATRGRSREEGVRYVVTVPASWSERAKKLIRDAARLAKLDEDGDLLISIEPEAASYAIRKNLRVLSARDPAAQEAQEQVFRQRETAHRGRGHAPDEAVVGADRLIICPEDAYMVCDCGGGTIDFTSHVVVGEGVVREALAHEAGKWGSCTIDVALLELLGELFKRGGADADDDVMKAMRREAPVDFLALVDHCELAKVRASPRFSSVNVHIPACVVDYLERYHDHKPLEDVIQANWATNPRNSGQRSDRLSYHAEEDTLVLPQALFVREILRPTHEQIIKHVHALMAHRYMREHCRYLFLVGGFAGSNFLREELVDECREHFPKVRVFRPTDPQHAIVEGAVLFGRNPEYISSRKAKFSLGFEVMRAFRLDDPQHLRVMVPAAGGRQMAMCRRVFQPLVNKGQTIDVNHAVTQTYQVPAGKQHLRVTLYQARYTTPPQHLNDPLDPLFTEFCQITVDNVDQLRLGPRRALQLEFRFGITEIELRVTNPNDPQAKLEFRIDFNVGNYKHEKTDLLDRTQKRQ